MTPTFGIFDHIEDIPGTPTHRLLQDRLALAKLADEAGFASFHLAEHHGSGLCMAPTQEIFIGAASRSTKTIRLGPMVKLLPLHHPVRIIEDMCVADQLTGGRLDFGVGRGVAPIEHAWFGSKWTESRERFEDTSASSATRCHGRDLERGQRLPRFPDRPARDQAPPGPDPVLVPGQPADCRAPRHEPHVRRPVSQATYDRYVEQWEQHRGDTLRLDGPNSRPRVGCTMIVAIAPSEKEALAIARRGMDGLVRRTKEAHTSDHLVLSEAECANGDRTARGHPRHHRGRHHAGAGVPDQIAERFAAILESGLVDHIALQVPTGDMTYDEARRTVELFASEVKPQLERQFG